MIPKFSHDFFIEKQITSIVELLDILKDYKRLKKNNVTSHELFFVPFVVI